MWLEVIVGILIAGFGLYVGRRRGYKEGYAEGYKKGARARWTQKFSTLNLTDPETNIVVSSRLITPN